MEVLNWQVSSEQPDAPSGVSHHARRDRVSEELSFKPDRAGATVTSAPGEADIMLQPQEFSDGGFEEACGARCAEVLGSMSILQAQD